MAENTSYIINTVKNNSEYDDKKTMISLLDNDYFKNGFTEEYLIPVSYIPLDVKNNEYNFNLLSHNNNISDSEYNALNETADPAKNVSSETLKNNLLTSIINLNDPNKTYNVSNIMSSMILMCFFLWSIILYCLLKILYYYSYEYYSIILIILTTIIVFSAVFWKIYNTMVE